MSWKKEIRDTSSERLILGLLVLAIATNILRSFGVPWNNLLMLGGVGIIFTIPLTIQAYLMIFNDSKSKGGSN